MREAAQTLGGVGDPDHAQQLDGPRSSIGARHATVCPNGLDHLLLDGQHRVEAGHWVLEDHGHVATADLAQLGLRQTSQVLAVEDHPAALDPAGRLGQQPNDREVGHALAAAGLTDDPEPLALVQRKADPIDGVDRAVMGAELHDEVLDQQECHGLAYRLSRGSSDSRNPSPRRLNPIALMTIAIPGKKIK